MKERVEAEIERVIGKNRSQSKKQGREDKGFASVFEAWAIVKEELDEFKDWVWKKPHKRNPQEMLRELVQVAANLRVTLVCNYNVDERSAATRLASIVCAEGRDRIASPHDAYGRILSHVEAWKANVFGFASDLTLRPTDAIAHAEAVCFKATIDLRLLD